MNDLISASEAMREVLTAALDVSDTPTTVLLSGESGSGKEIVARFIHDSSNRKALPYTVVSALTFSMDDVTAALNHGGTVVFNEVSTLSIESQGQLLAALETPHTSRVIAISNRDLAQLVERGTLRSDLYYRLDVFPIQVPSLRDRREDVAPLASLITRGLAQRLGKPNVQLAPSAVTALENAELRGNVREMANVIERAIVRSRSSFIEGPELGLSKSDIALTSTYPSSMPLDLGDLERIAIREALRRVNGNRTHAAKLLGIGLRTLRQKLNGPPSSDRNEVVTTVSASEPS